MPVTIASFSADEFVVKWKEEFLSQALNKKLVGSIAPGVYRGFILTPSATNRTLDCIGDPSFTNDHVAVILDNSSGEDASIAVHRTGGVFAIPLTDGSLTSQTVIVALTAVFSTSATTTASIVAYTSADFAALTSSQRSRLTVLGTVVVPGTSIPIPAANITRTNRDEAWQNVAPQAVGWSPLIRNGGFEWSTPTETAKYAAAMWESQVDSGTFTWQPVTTAAHTGSKSLEINVGAAGAISGKTVQYLHVPVIVGQGIKVSLWKRVLAASVSGTLEVVLQWADSTGADLSTTLLTVPTTGTDAAFIEVTATTNVPTGAVFLKRAELKATTLSFAAATGAVLRADDIQVWLEAGSALKTAGFEERQAKAEEVRSLTLRAGETMTEAAALLTFDPSTPASIGTVTLDRRDQSAGQAPSLKLPGQIANLGASLLSAIANADLARLHADASIFAGVEYTLIWKSVPAATNGTRLYATAGGGVVFTVNAVWNNTTNVWDKDVAGNVATKLLFDGTDLKVQKRNTGAGTWADSAWSVADLTGVLADGSWNIPGAAGVSPAALLQLGDAIVAADVQTPRIRVPHQRPASDQFTLLVDSPPAAAGTVTPRIYVKDNSGGNDPVLVFTMNAKWLSGTTLWTADNNTLSAAKFEFTRYAGFQVSRQDSTGTDWADGGFVGHQYVFPATSGTRGLYEGVDACFKVDSPTTGTGGSNPPATTAVTNELRASSMPKAWGKLTTVSGGNPTVNEGFNVASAVSFASGASARVTLAAAMSSVNYAVIVTIATPPNYFATASVVDSSTFDIYVNFHDGTAFDIDGSSGLGISFVVFGKQ